MSYSWNTTATYGMMGFNQWQPILFYGKDIKGFGSVNGILKSDSIKLSGGASIGFLSKCPKGKHPCPKPEIIIKKLIARLSNEGDTILDPFLGSGTTAVACKELKRNCIGIEISKEYFEIAQKRINNTQEMML
jgi:DNA modification methylase